MKDWQRYEKDILDQLKSKFDDAVVSHNVKLPGQLSKTDRQIDVLIVEEFQSHNVRTAVEAKFYSKPLDVKQVESFISMLQDIGVDRGIMICPLGFSKAAYQRAFADDVDLDLDIFSYESFMAWQAEGAIPYSGKFGFLLPAPFGWVIDIRRINDAIAHLYRVGRDARQAYEENEFMYLNIWHRDHEVGDLDQLLLKQESDLLKNIPTGLVTVSEFGYRKGIRTCLRRFESHLYPSAELTAFAEFEECILYIVMYSPLHIERRNLRKLEYLIQKVVPVKVSL